MSTRTTHRFLLAGGLGLAAAFVAGAGAGELGSKRGHTGGLAFGEPGRESEVSRTVEIVMGDNYFEPETISARPGETIRFVVRNQGEFLHEFNIGTTAMHAEHQEEMMAMMEHGMLTPTGIDHDMMKMDHGSNGMSVHIHDDPNSVLVEPGQARDLIWKFTHATDLEFACNVPGHYDAGMMGRLTVTEKPSGS